MERIRDSVTYQDFVICDRCQEEIYYHVTDIKGVTPRYITCPSCGNKILIPENFPKTSR